MFIMTIWIAIKLSDYDKLKIGTKYFPNHFIPIMKNISIKNSFGSINGSFFKGNFYIDLKKNKLYYE